ncbi:MAG: hypothetical protein DRR06_17250 [Gammaproteobacteria bacterium]|nr:MAG: hypothetical protein DRR06_17250 [Gammaproteobacteria bacterium]
MTDETLSYEVIKETVAGPGHYLGSMQTMKMMRTEFLYPDIANRDSTSVWEEAGSHDIREVARERVREILSAHYPNYINARADSRIRDRFPIHIPAAAMQPGNGRW